MTQTPAADIVERLCAHMGKADIQDVLPDCREAATEIEALRAREAELQRKLDEAFDPLLCLVDIILSEAPADAKHCTLYTDQEGEAHALSMDELRAIASIRGETD